LAKIKKQPKSIEPKPEETEKEKEKE